MDLEKNNGTEAQADADVQNSTNDGFAPNPNGFAPNPNGFAPNPNGFVQNTQPQYNDDAQQSEPMQMNYNPEHGDEAMALVGKKAMTILGWAFIAYYAVSFAFSIILAATNEQIGIMSSAMGISSSLFMGITIATSACGVVLGVVPMIFAMKGHNWARITTIVIQALAAVSTVFSLVSTLVQANDTATLEQLKQVYGAGYDPTANLGITVVSSVISVIVSIVVIVVITANKNISEYFKVRKYKKSL